MTSYFFEIVSSAPSATLWVAAAEVAIAASGAAAMKIFPFLCVRVSSCFSWYDSEGWGPSSLSVPGDLAEVGWTVENALGHSHRFWNGHRPIPS